MSHHNAQTPASSNGVAPEYTTVPPMFAQVGLLLSLERHQYPLGSIEDMQRALGPMASLHKMHQAFLRIHEDQLVRLTNRLNELERAHHARMQLDDFNFNFLRTCIDTRVGNVYTIVEDVQKHMHECMDSLDERITSMARLSREREFMVDRDIRVLSRVQGILARRRGLRRYRPYFHKVCVGDEDREEVFGESDEEGSSSDMELESDGEGECASNVHSEDLVA